MGVHFRVKCYYILYINNIRKRVCRQQKNAQILQVGFRKKKKTLRRSNKSAREELRRIYYCRFTYELLFLRL